MQKKPFVVDAALLRELGERLIGRPAIALSELVKNSYDADASKCRIEFGDDSLAISDDGHGMSESDFLEYWMRIGTTHKVEEGVSKGGRPLTGSKGIGRLSVQFLAHEMTLESTSADSIGRSLYSYVDWREAVSGKDLSTVNVLWDTRTTGPEYPNGHPTGTRITLTGLQAAWDAAALKDLGDDVWVLRSPFRKSALPRKSHPGPEDFEVEIIAPGIEGGQEAFDERKRTVLSNWKARIKGSLDGGRTGGKATVFAEFKEGYPEGSAEARRFKEIIELPIRGDDQESLIDRLSFEILIFRTEGRQPSGVPVTAIREYLSKFGNVSVYDAGFRLPYYGSGREAAGQDWLQIALDQGRRLNASELLPEHLRTQNKYMQDLPAPGRIFGAVDIDTNHERAAAQNLEAKPGQWLQIQPGRDRLHDNLAFLQLRDLVRFSLDFYANRHRLLTAHAVERTREKEQPSTKLERVARILGRNKEDIPKAVYREVTKELSDARKTSKVQEGVVDRRAALLAPLAAAGMAALALNHEISRESRFLDRVDSQLRRLAKKHSIPELTELASEFAAAARRLESLQELFAPLLSDMDKTATHRLKVRAVVEQTVSAMRPLMPGVQFGISVHESLRFPLGALAEWNALLQNVLSNSWNAMLDSKVTRVIFTGGQDKRTREWLRVSDTGVGLGLPLDEAPKLFEPFERRLKISADKRSIAIGGQGLGLAIVRMIARRRGANVAFVNPEPNFSTTFELSWRGASK